MTPYDAIIVGAGAAGLMCALRAGQRGRAILVLDHSSEPGQKIIISGGGRCNFTNLQCAPDRFISENPHFCISALKSYTQNNFLELVRKHQISYHEKTLGQLFCDGSSQQILKLLLDECEAGHVTLRLGETVKDINHADGFQVKTDRDTYHSKSLIIATGGLSIPKMGATGFAYETAQHFNIRVTETRAALAPLTFTGEILTSMQNLTGVSLPVTARYGKVTFDESMVFTHRGLSGPAILQISSFWRSANPLTLDLAPGIDVQSLLIDRKKTRPKSELQTILGEILPQRLAQSITASEFEASPMGSFSHKYLEGVTHRLKHWSILPSGSEGYTKAEVTSGGIDTSELSSKTMEAKSVRGLYFIGEAVDVTGWLGGYNFQWAWSSGWAAGTAI